MGSSSWSCTSQQSPCPCSWEWAWAWAWLWSWAWSDMTWKSASWQRKEALPRFNHHTGAPVLSRQVACVELAEQLACLPQLFCGAQSSPEKQTSSEPPVFPSCCRGTRWLLSTRRPGRVLTDLRLSLRLLATLDGAQECDPRAQQAAVSIGFTTDVARTTPRLAKTPADRARRCSRPAAPQTLVPTTPSASTSKSSPRYTMGARVDTKRASAAAMSGLRLRLCEERPKRRSRGVDVEIWRRDEATPIGGHGVCGARRIGQCSARRPTQSVTGCPHTTRTYVKGVHNVNHVKSHPRVSHACKSITPRRTHSGGRTTTTASTPLSLIAAPPQAGIANLGVPSPPCPARCGWNTEPCTTHYIGIMLYQARARPRERRMYLS